MSDEVEVQELPESELPEGFSEVEEVEDDHAADPVVEDPLLPEEDKEEEEDPYMEEVSEILDPNGTTEYSQ